MIKIFVLNLKRSPERRKLIQSQMEKFGLKFEFIDAVDGNELTKEQLSRVDKFKSSLRLGRKITNNEVGCALSHSNTYKKIIDERITDAIILEDDCILTEQFADFIKKKIFKKIDKDFIFLFSSYVFYKSKSKFSKDITLYEPYINPAGAVAYYINNKMAKQLYNHTKVIEYVADYPILLSNLGNVSVIKPNIITTGEFESTIIRGNKFKSWLWYQIRSKLFIEYIFNKKKYNNLYEYVNAIYFKKNKYKD